MSAETLTLAKRLSAERSHTDTNGEYGRIAEGVNLTPGGPFDPIVLPPSATGFLTMKSVHGRARTQTFQIPCHFPVSAASHLCSHFFAFLQFDSVSILPRAFPTYSTWPSRRFFSFQKMNQTVVK